MKEDENSGVKWVNIDEVIPMSTEPQMHVIFNKINEKQKAYISKHTKYFVDKYINHTLPMYKTEDFRSYYINNKIRSL